MMKKDFINVYNRLLELHKEFTELRLRAYEKGSDFRDTQVLIVNIIHESVTIICGREELEDIFFKGKSERYRSEFKLSRIFLATNYAEYLPKYLAALKKIIIDMKPTPKEFKSMNRAD